MTGYVLTKSEFLWESFLILLAAFESCSLEYERSTSIKSYSVILFD